MKRATRSCWFTASFFRDWQLVNYWGRIPRALTRCGATVFTAGSSPPCRWRRAPPSWRNACGPFCGKLGAEKVNLIAHSRGRTGQPLRDHPSRACAARRVPDHGQHPHRGCIFAEELLRTPAERRDRPDGAPVQRPVPHARRHLAGFPRRRARSHAGELPVLLNRETPDRRACFTRA